MRFLFQFVARERRGMHRPSVSLSTRTVGVRRPLSRAFVGISFAVVTGCAVGPDYHRPAMSIPDSFASATSGDAATPLLTDSWWTLFADSQLTALEEEASLANTDLRVAIARVDQARAMANSARSFLFPSLIFNPAITRSRTAVRSSGGGSSVVTGDDPSGINQGSPGGTATRPSGIESTRVRLPFDLSYELDIWGRVRRQYESADAKAEAAAADAEFVRTTIHAEVAVDYFGAGFFLIQEKILDETVQSYKTQLDLVKKQVRAGLVGQTDFFQAEALLHATSSQLFEAKRQKEDLLHALAVLVGKTPTQLTTELQPPHVSPPVVPAGLPADVLRRRPDVAEAEQNLISANADVGQAIASFLPSIQLTGSAGFEAFSTSHLLDAGNKVWSLGAAGSLPLFEGGKLIAALDEARARYREELAAYEGKVLTAIKEVEDALTDLHYRSRETEAQEAAVSSSQSYTRLATLQYQQGLTSYLQVIDAERTLLSNEIALAQIQSQRFASTVLLIKALGGGWQTRNERSAAQTTN